MRERRRAQMREAVRPAGASSRFKCPLGKAVRAMVTIHKYPLQIADVQELELPGGAEVLSIQEQRNQLQLWAVVDTGMPLKRRRFRIIGTGHDFPQLVALKYIQTVQMGPLVWHVFEEKN